MSMLTGYEGFPIWGNLSPQKASLIPGRQIALMVQDAAVNQVFGGNAQEIPLVQRIRPKVARAEGPGITQSQNVGSFGSNLYDAFMLPILGSEANK